MATVMEKPLPAPPGDAFAVPGASSPTTRKSSVKAARGSSERGKNHSVSRSRGSVSRSASQSLRSQSLSRIQGTDLDFLKVFITGTETRGEPSVHVVYKVSVMSPHTNWHCFRRYSHFETLRDRLTRYLPHVMSLVSASFPAKKLAGSGKASRLLPGAHRRVVDERCVQLQKWLQQLALYREISRSAEFLQFVAPGEFLSAVTSTHDFDSANPSAAVTPLRIGDGMVAPPQQQPASTTAGKSRRSSLYYGAPTSGGTWGRSSSMRKPPSAEALDVGGVVPEVDEATGMPRRGSMSMWADPNSPTRAFITSTETRAIPSLHTVYVLSVVSNGEHWSCPRRYSDFVMLAELIASNFPKISLPDLPPKVLANAGIFTQLAPAMSKRAINQRIPLLQAWLSALMRTRIADSPEVQQFLAEGEYQVVGSFHDSDDDDGEDEEEDYSEEYSSDGNGNREGDDAEPVFETEEHRLQHYADQDVLVLDAGPSSGAVSDLADPDTELVRAASAAQRVPNRLARSRSHSGMVRPRLRDRERSHPSRKSSHKSSRANSKRVARTSRAGSRTGSLSSNKTKKRSGSAMSNRRTHRRTVSGMSEGTTMRVKRVFEMWITRSEDAEEMARAEERRVEEMRARRSKRRDREASRATSSSLVRPVPTPAVPAEDEVKSDKDDTAAVVAAAAAADYQPDLDLIPPVETGLEQVPADQAGAGSGAAAAAAVAAAAAGAAGEDDVPMPARRRSSNVPGSQDKMSVQSGQDDLLDN